MWYHKCHVVSLHCPVMDLKVHKKRWNLVEGQFVEIPMTADGGGQGFLSVKIVRDYQTIKELVLSNNTDPGRIILLQTKTGKLYFSLHFSFCKCEISPLRNAYIDCQSPFTELWQSCRDPHLKIRSIAIFVFYSLKLQSHCTLTRQFSPKVAHKGRDKEKITPIYYLWMVDNERGREW